MQGANKFGTVPIGAIVAWLPDFTGTPSLPAEFWRCDGTTISDSESIYNGRTAPNLNATNRYFLRGNSASGGTSGVANHAHAVSFHHHDVTPNSISICSFAGCTPITVASINTVASADANPTTDTQSNLPPAYDVVWIMRIK